MRMYSLVSWSGIIGLCLLFLSGTASVNAQEGEEADVEEILVTAPRVTVDESQRTTIRGGGRVSMSYGVGYADLDLTRADDRAELEQRVQDAAAQICELLAERYSAGPFTAGQCTREAQNEAMARVRQAVEAAAN